MSEASSWESPPPSAAINFYVLLSSREALDRDILLARLTETFSTKVDSNLINIRLRQINFVLGDQLQTFGRFSAKNLDFDVILEGVIMKPDPIEDIGQHLVTLCTSIDPGSSWLDPVGIRVLITEACSTPQAHLARRAAGQGKPIKMMAQVHRRPGLSACEFRNHYEKNHAPLAVRHRSSLLCGYRRNYVVASFRPATGSPLRPIGDEDIPDAFSEFHFADSTAFAGMQQVDPVLGPLIQQDERFLFDIDKVRLFLVDEVSM